jgi:ubiquinone/menaquinone biosynthesis C-methylase UbiE
MSSESISSLESAGNQSEVLAWSEDLLTARARSIWGGADFLPIARSFETGAADFIARLALRPGESVLDVACGTGNLAIPAARAGARVSGIDIASNLIVEAQLQARTAGLAIDFEVGNAESLPYGNAQFDTTVTMFGAMFAYRPVQAANELVRVTRPGGRIAMANWTSTGFVGHLLRAHAAVVPPPEGVPSPLLWGDEEIVRARFGNRIKDLKCVRRTLELRFPLPPAAVTELFATYYGPTVTTLKAAGPDGRQRLRFALTELFREHNLAPNGYTVVAGEYLDVQARVA